MNHLFKNIALSTLAMLFFGIQSCDSTLLGGDDERGTATNATNNSKGSTNKTNSKKRNRNKNNNSKKDDDKSDSKNLNVNPSQICKSDVSDETFIVGDNKDFYIKNIFKDVLDDSSVIDTPCKDCHIGPRKNPRVAGAPEIMHDYCLMYPLLRGNKAEPDPINNPLMLRAINYVKHSGGDFCPNGLGDPVCSAILDWYEKEFDVTLDRDSLVKPEPADAAIVEATVNGFLLGYAVDPADRTQTVGISVYINDPNTTGGTAIEGTADTSDFKGITGGSESHGFKIKIPDAFLDGSNNKAYIYRVTASGAEVAVEGSPVDFSSYAQKAKANYDDNVATQLQNSCGSCHSFGNTYSGDWNYLVTPRPNDGGTATTNRLYQKGTGGGGHGGGSQCNGACATALQNWWTAEFGN